MRSAFIASLVGLGFSGVAHAETWNCQSGSFWTQSGAVVVRATNNVERGTGVVEVAGVKHDSRYEVRGFDRRWDFGLARDGSYDYAFVVEPEGDAKYYDFTRVDVGDVVSPRQFFVCKKVG